MWKFERLLGTLFDIQDCLTVRKRPSLAHQNLLLFVLLLLILCQIKILFPHVFFFSSPVVFLRKFGNEELYRKPTHHIIQSGAIRLVRFEFGTPPIESAYIPLLINTMDVICFLQISLLRVKRVCIHIDVIHGF
jgi:hypothetical protein